MGALMIQFCRLLCGSIGMASERMVVFDRRTFAPLNFDSEKVEYEILFKSPEKIQKKSGEAIK